ncbi:MAG: Rpn family recombination-promoting nuclease/putative transposase [Cyanobacteria bacterium P01_A01_bin.84]
MKTDSIFYRLFQNFPDIFFELINKPTQLADIYRFSSVEVKQLAFRIDGVFLPQEDTPEIPIYFLEVQFQPDKKLYSRVFTEIFNYLDKTELHNDWHSVLIFPSRNIDTSETLRYRELLHTQRVTRVYLDELNQTPTPSLLIETVKLVVEPENLAAIKAKELINSAQQEINDLIRQRELIQFIETIIVYKFPRLNRKEIEKMLGLGELKQTKVYQEAFQEGKEEGKLETIPKFLTLGLTVEQIAQALGLDVEIVRQAAQGKS